MVGGVLLPVLEAGWQTGGKELATRVSAPSVWVDEADDLGRL